MMSVTRRRELVEEVARQAFHFAHNGGPRPELVVTWSPGPMDTQLTLRASGYVEKFDSVHFQAAGRDESVLRLTQLGGEFLGFARRVIRHELDEGIRLSTEVRWGARPELAEALNELELVVDRLGA